MFTVNVHVEHKLLQSFYETNQRKKDELELNTFFTWQQNKSCFNHEGQKIIKKDFSKVTKHSLTVSKKCFTLPLERMVPPLITLISREKTGFKCQPQHKIKSNQNQNRRLQHHICCLTWTKRAGTSFRETPIDSSIMEE